MPIYTSIPTTLQVWWVGAYGTNAPCRKQFLPSRIKYNIVGASDINLLSNSSGGALISPNLSFPYT